MRGGCTFCSTLESCRSWGQFRVADQSGRAQLDGRWNAASSVVVYLKSCELLRQFGYICAGHAPFHCFYPRRVFSGGSFQKLIQKVDFTGGWGGERTCLLPGG